MNRKQLTGAVIMACIGLMLASVRVEPRVRPHWQKGTASWYGEAFAGRKTASGERFSPKGLTAAHRQLPLGTKVMVKNLETQELEEVKINDRGPYAAPRQRIIDLSKAAADRIGLGGDGVARVEVVVTEDAATPQHPYEEMLYEVQVGAFKEPGEATAVVDQLRERYPAVYIAPRDGPLGRYYRVRMGPFRAPQELRRVAHALQREGHPLFVDEVPARTFWSRDLG